VTGFSEGVRDFYERHHESAERARARRSYFYSYLTRMLRASIPAGAISVVGSGRAAPAAS